MTIECEWPAPTAEMVASAEFEAVWQCIKKWDISVPDAYEGYCGATGNHVRAILDALREHCRIEIARLRADNERTHALVRAVSDTRDTAVNMHLKDTIEIAQLRAEKIEMADAILQIGGLSEMHFRTLVSFETAEFVFTERLAERKG